MFSIEAIRQDDFQCALPEGVGDEPGRKEGDAASGKHCVEYRLAMAQNELALRREFPRLPVGVPEHPRLHGAVAAVGDDGMMRQVLDGLRSAARLKI